MGQPLRHPLASQHERLILELLPFKDTTAFHDWLEGVYVRGSWHEFCRDFLASNPMAPEPDKHTTAQAARDAIKSKSPKYLLYHPDKAEWTEIDHHIRFIVLVVTDNMLQKLWSDREWSQKGVEITKAVYEVLSFLRSGQVVSNQGPPGYEASV